MQERRCCRLRTLRCRATCACAFIRRDREARLRRRLALWVRAVRELWSGAALSATRWWADFAVNDGSQKRYAPGVVVVAEHAPDKAVFERTLVHELVHAYDQCRAKVDWKSGAHHACAEIRASSLSGECDLSQEINRGVFGLMAHHGARVGGGARRSRWRWRARRARGDRLRLLPLLRRHGALRAAPGLCGAGGLLRRLNRIGILEVPPHASTTSWRRVDGVEVDANALGHRVKRGVTRRGHARSSPTSCCRSILRSCRVGAQA